MEELKYRDFTIKAKLKNSKAVEKKLEAMNSTFIGLDVQVDHYFQTAKGKLKWREGTIENLITHYERIWEAGFEKTIVYRYDLNPTKDQIDELLEGFRKIGEIKKERKIYWVNNLKIHIDQLPDKNIFIEIEAIDKENFFDNDELKEQCMNMKTKLGIDDKDLIPTGYMKEG